MSGTTIDVKEAQPQLLQLLAVVLEGGDVVIAKDNIPLARLVPVAQPTERRIAGLHRGVMRMRDDFDHPLSSDLVSDFPEADTLSK